MQIGLNDGNRYDIGTLSITETSIRRTFYINGKVDELKPEACTAIMNSDWFVLYDDNGGETSYCCVHYDYTKTTHDGLIQIVVYQDFGEKAQEMLDRVEDVAYLTKQSTLAISLLVDDIVPTMEKKIADLEKQLSENSVKEGNEEVKDDESDSNDESR